MTRRSGLRRAAAGALGLAAGLALAGVAAAQSILRDAEIEAYLADYAHPLMEAAGVDPAGIDILLIGDDTLNAFAGPGVMGMHTGLITTAETPNQIEGVLAHEVGHLAGAHAVRSAEAYARAGRPALMSLVLGAALIAAGAPPEAGIGTIGLGQNVARANILSYSRGQESAADQLGASYLEQVGSSTDGLVEFFGILSNRQLISARRIPPYALTHPLGQARMSRLRERAEANTAPGDTEDEVHRLRMIQAKINGFMDAPYTTLRRYPLADQSKPARYARAVAYYRASDLDAAMREIGRLVEAEPDNPYFAELLGQMLFEHGRVAEAVAPHRRSVSLAPQHPILKVNLARALVATEEEASVREAIGLLNVALDLEPDNAFAWTELARAQARLGNEPAAALAQAEAYYQRRALPEAHRFATLAAEQFEPGSPEHTQALDIVGASVDAARRARR